MSGRFHDKVALVTGGSLGIGAAIVSQLVAEGAQVMIGDLNEPANSDSIAFHQTDVRNHRQVEALVMATVDRFGRLDVLVNNAGVGWLAETPEMDEIDWDRLFAVNVSSVFYTCKAAIPRMREVGAGAIVNIASVSGLAGDYGMGAYNASKGAVINYTRSLAIDCGRDNIRVNALCPGAIEQTGMQVGSHGGQAYRTNWLERIPLGRFGKADEMAKAALFLASDDASYMTGSIVTADGGITAHTGQLNFPAMRRQRESGT